MNQYKCEPLLGSGGSPPVVDILVLESESRHCVCLREDSLRVRLTITSPFVDVPSDDVTWRPNG
jgi:hypothetical protein